MIIPENILYHTVRGLQAFIEKDWEDNTDKTRTILYELFYKDDNGIPMTLNKFNYYDQAQHIFLKGKDNSRKMQVNVGYNVQRAGLPTIHILLPNEEKDEMGLGMGEGYQDKTFYPETEEWKTNFTGVWKSNYNLMITSDNSSEVVLMYHAFKNLFLAAFVAFEFRGLRDISFGGQDLQFTNDIVPPEVFHRSLMVSFFYESTVNALVAEKIAKKLISNPEIISSEQIINNNIE